mgnify:CR=1 FL=1
MRFRENDKIKSMKIRADCSVGCLPGARRGQAPSQAYACEDTRRCNTLR